VFFLDKKIQITSYRFKAKQQRLSTPTRIRHYQVLGRAQVFASQTFEPCQAANQITNKTAKTGQLVLLFSKKGRG